MPLLSLPLFLFLPLGYRVVFHNNCQLALDYFNSHMRQNPLTNFCQNNEKVPRKEDKKFDSEIWIYLILYKCVYVLYMDKYLFKYMHSHLKII